MVRCEECNKDKGRYRFLYEDGCKCLEEDYVPLDIDKRKELTGYDRAEEIEKYDIWLELQRKADRRRQNTDRSFKYRYNKGKLCKACEVPIINKNKSGYCMVCKKDRRDRK